MKLMSDIYISCAYDGFCRHHDTFNHMTTVEEMKNKSVTTLNYLVSVYLYTIFTFFSVFIIYNTKNLFCNA